MHTIPTPVHLRRFLATAALLALTTAAFAQDPAPAATGATTAAPGGAPAAAAAKPLSPADKKFIKDTAKSFYYELQLAEYATKGAKAEATKKFAATVNADLNKAWPKLGEIARTKGETVPTELTGGDKGSAERLKKTKEDGFDKLFFREILKEAKGVVRDFESAVKTSVDPEIKQFANDYLHTVRNHLAEGDKAEKEAAKAK